MNTERIMEIRQYFSPMDMKIIDLVTKGKKPEKIAKRLSISTQAVELHIRSIRKVISEAYCDV